MSWMITRARMKLGSGFWRCLGRASLRGLCVAASVALPASAPAAGSRLILSCDANNDLYRVLVTNRIACSRFDCPEGAVGEAAAGGAVLILADGYPQKPTALAPGLFTEAARKQLRLYVEYPAELPGLRVGAPRAAVLERALVTSSVFGPTLDKLSLLAIHDCRFTPVSGVPDPLLGLARVAGFDRAVYPLHDAAVQPLLFQMPEQRMLVSTTKLSQFVTARYAPSAGLRAIWRMILQWLQPEESPRQLEWAPAVRPTYDRGALLAAGAASNAVIRAVDWHTKSRMLPHESWSHRYWTYRQDGTINGNLGPRPAPGWPAGDGRQGMLEGFASRIQADGHQPVRWWLRSDSIGESSLSFALRARLGGDARSRLVASNLLDFVYFNSGRLQSDPTKPSFGLLLWAPDKESLYGDNDIKAILGCMGTAALLQTDHWDLVLLQNILGNFRTTGALGFREASLNRPRLLQDGWQSAWRRRTVNYAPHYEAWPWAAYLWLYDKTGYRPLLERTRLAVQMMMEAYPEQWRWTNGMQQERGRMLLPLAWLIRAEDRPQYRVWMKRLAADIEKAQDSSGAIREELGALRMGRYPPPQSNTEYGKNETSILQANGDPVADLLYTCNFTFLGLHEAFAATGDPQYKRMADKLADFLVRVQIRSETQPELDGAWFRAFDFSRWEYWGSNADSGWGAWSIEVGWTQGWVSTVLALRELGLNLWDLTRDTRIARHWEQARALMLPE